MGRRHLYTIPPDIPFLRALAQGVIDRGEEDLTRTLILLPTRRASRALRDIFIELNDGRPVLLPRLQPLGDVDADELDFHIAGQGGLEDLPEIPPAMPQLKRLMLLGQLVRARDESLSPQQTLWLANALAMLIDQVHTENLSFARLPDLVPAGELAAHWGLTLRFLEIVTQQWPEILSAHGEIDAADRRNRLMQALIQVWRATPPAHAVIAAGSTGSIPATADLLGLISELPQGAVILPGLDRDLDQESWDRFGATHPQATMRALLNRLGTDRREVALWPAADTKVRGPRVALGREIMRPAETIQDWTTLPLRPEAQAELARSLDGFDLIEARTVSDEAQAIAVVLRETLETPGRTAALVTPDRELARRVSGVLKKWNVLVDDSAGCSLSALPAGRFLSTILTCVREDFSPLSLINLLKHPLCRRFDLGLVNLFDALICRGARPAPGFDELAARAAAVAGKFPALPGFVADLASVFAPFAPLRQGLHSLQDYIAALIALAETLSLDRDTAWGNDDGEEAGRLLAGLHEQHAQMPPCDLPAFIDMFEYLLGTATVRPRRDSHPRLVILGQIEARMMRRDVMVLGGLNEGNWPAQARHDPWMSRPMRADFGLPSPERSIGLSAHDFAQAICCDRVVLTRSLKVDGAPTVPSRWLQRLQTLLQAAAIPFSPDSTYAAWARQLQHTGSPGVPAPRPEPRPPVAARPAELSVTQVERLMTNPYHVYVAKILRLRPLDPIDQDLSLAERGSFVHKALELFLRETGPGPLPPGAKDRLLEIARREAETLRTDTAAWKFWWPRFERIADWFIAQENAWRAQAEPWLLEAEGSYTFPTARGQFTLTARADRIDRLKTGGAAIIDYKTGTPPGKAQVASGEKPQLPLEALILRRAGFGATAEAALLCYWQLNGGASAGRKVEIEPGPADDPDNLIDAADRGLKNLIAAFDQPDTPFIAHAPKSARPYDDEKAVAHLARVAEWGSLESADEEAA